MKPTMGGLVGNGWEGGSWVVFVICSKYLQSHHEDHKTAAIKPSGWADHKNLIFYPLFHRLSLIPGLE